MEDAQKEAIVEPNDLHLLVEAKNTIKIVLGLFNEFYVQEENFDLDLDYLHLLGYELQAHIVKKAVDHKQLQLETTLKFD